MTSRMTLASAQTVIYELRMVARIPRDSSAVLCKGKIKITLLSYLPRMGQLWPLKISLTKPEQQ